MLLESEKTLSDSNFALVGARTAFANGLWIPADHSEMTSVLYGSGLNYQIGNPVRSEIRQVDRKVEELRVLFDKMSAGGVAAAAAPAAAAAADVDARFESLKADIERFQATLQGISGKVEAVTDIGSRVQRVESSHLGSSGMLMEMRTMLDKLVARVDALEKAAAATTAAATA